MSNSLTALGTHNLLTQPATISATWNSYYDLATAPLIICGNCGARHDLGMAGDKAVSQDEAIVSAHAHDWFVTGKVRLCPECTRLIAKRCKEVESVEAERSGQE